MTSLGLPGKSSVTLVPWLLSYFSAIHNFDSAKKLASFCGLHLVSTNREPQ
jgi:hypothetical protein